MNFRASQRLLSPNDSDSARYSTTDSMFSRSHQSSSDISTQTFDDKISNLEKLYIQNCEEILRKLKPNFMSSENFDTLLQRELQFPSFEIICEKLKKNPENIFENIRNIEFHSVIGNSGYWLAMKSTAPSWHRLKLEINEFWEFIKERRPILKAYTKEAEKSDEEFFGYEQSVSSESGLGDCVADEISQLNLPEKKGWEEEFRDWPTSNENRIEIFTAIFNIERQQSDGTPAATKFIRNGKALAKFFPSGDQIRGCVMPKVINHYLQVDYILSELVKRKIKDFNEFQRLIAHLLQYPWARGREKSNLLICAEPFRGFKTALSSTFVKLVAEYKQLNHEVEAPPKRHRFNANPYILIFGKEDDDFTSLFTTLQPLIKGCNIKVPITFSCSNVRFGQNLTSGCDILFLDRKKLEFIRSGEINLCNLQHVVFLNVETFTGIHERHITDVHQIVQSVIEKRRFDVGKNGSSNSMGGGVQYIFQTYQKFNNWSIFERLFFLTQPICDNLGLVLPVSDYPETT